MKAEVGFTLAEVLITLGVIGIVAAMTLPALVKNYQKHEIETQLKKTYSDLENMIKRAEVDNESFEYWDFTNSRWYDKYFQPYLKASSCKGKNINYCFLSYGNSDLRVFRKANGTLIDGNEGHWAVAPKYMLPDGRAILIEPIFDSSFNRNWSYLNIVVDVNGAKGPCVMGWDVFLFTLFNYERGGIKHKGLKLGSIGGGDGAYKCPSERIKKECINSGYDCGLLIQRNNWKFPTDYPIKF